VIYLTHGSYIYQIADAINNLSNQLSPTSAKYTTVDTTTAGPQTIRTSDARVIGGFIPVTNNSATTPGVEQTFNYPFSDFAYPPVATATVQTTDENGTESSKDVTVTITDIVTNNLSGVVRFNTIGVASVRVNLIIIGIPV
jgi:hypothetical protein